MEDKAAAATKSSSGGKSYIQERHPRADQKRQRQPRAAQKGNHEGRQAWETRRQKHHDKKCRLLRCDFLASFRHPPLGLKSFSTTTPVTTHPPFLDPQKSLAFWVAASQALLQICATGGGWPVALQQRLLQLLQTPCEVR